MVTQRPRPQPVRPPDLDAALPDPVAKFLRDPWVASIQADATTLTERDYCELLLEFANAGTLPAEKWQALLCGAGPGSDPASARRWTEGVLTEGAVQLVRGQLGRLVKYGPKRAQPELGPYWSAEASGAGLVLMPSFDSQAGEVGVSYRLLTKNLWAAISYVMVLYFDKNRTFGRDLCRCKLEECSRFFFVKAPGKSGRPRRDYCSLEHSQEASRRQLRARVARHRARKK